MFRWLKRNLRTSSRPRKRLPERHLAPIEEIVEQGLLVTDVAVRMDVKNAIILNALGNKADYIEAEILDMVKNTLTELAEERERDARHIARMRAEIRRTGYSSWSENDYGSGDNRTLKHRQEVYEQVAIELRRRIEDDAYLNEASERARKAAWLEIGDSLKVKASHPYYAGGSSQEYQEARDARIQLLIERDLTELVQQHAADKTAEQSAEQADEQSAEKPTEKSKLRAFSRKPRS